MSLIYVEGDKAEFHRPGKEKYLSARMFEALPYVYGQTGLFLVGFYTYFRWVDDIADCPERPIDQRLKFLESQRQVIEGKREPEEQDRVGLLFKKLPWGAICTKLKPEVLNQFEILLSSITHDVNHYGLLAQSRPDIRINNLRTLLPYAEVISLALNGRKIGATGEFLDFLDHWNYVGAMLHFGKDLNEEKIIKIGFTDQEKVAINSKPGEPERRDEILRIFDKERFDREAALAMYGMFTLTRSLRTLDIPVYQQEISYRYMSIRQPLRLPKLIKKARDELYSE